MVCPTPGVRPKTVDTPSAATYNSPPEVLLKPPGLQAPLVSDGEFSENQGPNIDPGRVPGHSRNAPPVCRNSRILPSRVLRRGGVQAAVLGAGRWEIPARNQIGQAL